MEDINQVIANLSQGVLPSEDQVVDICNKAKQIMSGEPNVVKIDAPVTIVGDIKVQYKYVTDIFAKQGGLGQKTYVFLGGYVNRSKNGLEILLHLLCLKILYPQKIFILRGHMEIKTISQTYGFSDECKHKYPGSDAVFNACVETFNFMLLGALIQGSVLCLHGGLSPSIQKVNEIDALDRFQDCPQEGSMCDLIWSDPDDATENWAANPRGAGYLFGKTPLEEFLKNNGLDFIVRGHQLIQEGHRLQFDNKCITVWSGPNYTDQCGNAGSVMTLNQDLTYSFDTAQP